MTEQASLIVEGCSDTDLEPSRRAPWRRLAVVCLLLAGGCFRGENKSNQATVRGGPPLAGITLKLLVVDDPEMAKALRLLRGQWQGSSGAELEVAETSEQALLAAGPLDADCLIYPVRDLGLLAERDWLAPLDDTLPQDPSLDWPDVFESPKNRDAVWGATPYAVPFGSPVLVCAYRADLLRRIGREPPRTWKEYQQLAELLAKQGAATASEEQASQEQAGQEQPGQEQPGQEQPDGGGEQPRWAGALEPLAEGWAGLALLARAAPYARHRDQVSTWFDIETMEPLIAGPPFVRALDELAAAYGNGSHRQLDQGPADVWAAFSQGECGLAIAWPPPGSAGAAGRAAAPRSAASGDPVAGTIEIGFVELPGSIDVYGLESRQWQERRREEQPHVPLLGIDGRLGSVSKKSPHAEAAFRLLAWLSDPKLSTGVSSASRHATLFRRSHVAEAHKWVGAEADPEAAALYGEVVERSLDEHVGVDSPRIPGRGRYLAALDRAVRRRVQGEAASQAALDEAAAEWRKITEELGLAAQRSAYQRSLGLAGS
ncbi:MAG: extracellular solute-binding protein [Pirellulales bacterium]